MADFLDRETELLGSEFNVPAGVPSELSGDIDFDRAASAFPDISLVCGDQSGLRFWPPTRRGSVARNER